MRVNFSFYVFYIFLLKYILLQSTDRFIIRPPPEIITYQIVYFNSSENSLIYDCNNINLDKEIKVKISGNFVHKYIEYIFSDNVYYLKNKKYPLSGLKLVYPTN